MLLPFQPKVVKIEIRFEYDYFLKTVGFSSSREIIFSDLLLFVLVKQRFHRLSLFIK